MLPAPMDFREAGAQRDVALGGQQTGWLNSFFYRSDWLLLLHAQAPIIESMAWNYGFEVFGYW